MIHNIQYFKLCVIEHWFRHILWHGIFVLIIFQCYSAYPQQALWIKKSDTGNYDNTVGKRIAIHPNGSVYMLADMSGSVQIEGQELNSYSNIVLARFSAEGILIWAKLLCESPGYPINRAIDIKIDSKGDLVIVGASYNVTSFLGAPSGVGPFIAKMDADANLKWINYENSLSLLDSDPGRRGNRIVIDKHDNIIWFNDQIYTQNFSEHGGLALTKYAPDGNKIWNKIITGNPTFNHQIITGIVIDSDENIIVCGNFFTTIKIGPISFYNNQNSNTNKIQMFLAKFTSAGDYLWAIQSNNGASNVSTANGLDNAGNVYLMGRLNSGAKLISTSNTYTHDAVAAGFISKFSPSGALVWVRPITNGTAMDLIQDSNNQLYVTGQYYNDLQYMSYRKFGTYSQAFILKINDSGDLKGATAADGLIIPDYRYGTESVGSQSLLDTDGNIYTLGSFRGGLVFRCTSATTNNYSFFLVKHTIDMDLPSFNPSINGSNSILCSADNLTLSTDPMPDVLKYKWYIPSGVTSVTGDSETNENFINLNVSEIADQQLVYLVISTEDCIEYTSIPYQINVTIQPDLVEPVLGNSYVCPGSNETYSVNRDDKVEEYEWVFPAESTANQTSVDNSININFSQSFTQGNVVVTAKNACGSSSYSFPIEVFHAPEKPILNGDIKICSEETEIQKSIQPVAYALDYQWELPSLIIPNQSTTQNTTVYANVQSQFQYGEIRVRAIGQCKNSEYSDPIEISRITKPDPAESIIGPEKICITNLKDIEYKVPVISNATKYVWTTSDVFQRSGSLVSSYNIFQARPKSEGIGTIKVYGINSCNEKGDSATIAIHNFEKLIEPELESSKCGDEILITSPSEDYELYRNNVLLPNESKNIRVFPEDSGSYFVRVSNYCGLAESESIDVHPVKKNALIPNVITPNGDGKNDFFTLDPSWQNSYLLIFNRWGKEVYKSNNYNNEWDAFNSTAGTYYYFITNECFSAPYQGWINVIK
ncbi:MAG: gliding motility-associated C-terminal domain-containing protein [Cyclobacteriaceae bacterium]